MPARLVQIQCQGLPVATRRLLPVIAAVMGQPQAVLQLCIRRASPCRACVCFSRLGPKAALLVEDTDA